MRQRKLYAMSGLLAVLLLAGCSNDQLQPENNSDGRVALQVTSGIQTRAVNNLWENGDAIGIYMLDSKNTPDTYANIQYVTENDGTSGSFSPASGAETIYLPTDGSSRQFIAYYPWKNTLTGNAYPIDLTSQSDQSAIDFMIAEKVSGISRTNPAAQFQFAHKLSKIVMEIKPGVGVNNSDLQGLTVSLTNQPTSGTFDVLNGTAAVPGTVTGAIDLSVVANGTSAEGIVFPSDNYNGMDFKFHTQNIGDYECPVPSTNAQKFEAGKKYKYIFSINKTEITVTSEITDWLPGNGDNGDSGWAE